MTEFLKNDIAPFWREYTPLLEDPTSWYAPKYKRAFKLAHAPRRFSRPLAELSLQQIGQLERDGREPPVKRPGGHKNADRLGDEGFGYAREYLAAVHTIADQAHAGDVDRVHDAIRRGLTSVPAAGLPDVVGAAASAMIGLANGGPVATSSAMRAVQRFSAGLRR